MRGRKPKPLGVRASEGDVRKIGAKKLREKLAAEPPTTRGLPDPPDHLGCRARELWLFWVSELEGMGIDRRPDGIMLEGACVAYGQAVAADIMIEHDGIVVSEPVVVDGMLVGQKLKRHPAEAVSRRAWSQVKAFASEFGLSPVARARITPDKREAPMDLSALLSAPRAKREASIQ